MKLDYDEKSPLTGNHCVLVETDETTGLVSYICMESGFTTHEKLTNGSKFVQNYEKNLTQLMQDVKFIDTDRNLTWYPSFIQISGVGMLYVIGTSAANMQWQVARVVDLVGDERLKYPVPGNPKEYYTSRLDVENAITFESLQFADALDMLYTYTAEQESNLEKHED